MIESSVLDRIEAQPRPKVAGAAIEAAAQKTLVGSMPGRPRRRPRP